MYNGNRIALALILCFLFAGCSTPLIYVKTELEARDHMTDAAELEKSEDYSQAAQAYALVAEKYPSTAYYATAVHKAALLNIHPSNSKMDVDGALKWFAVYLSLPISDKEKEFVRSNIALLKKLKSMQMDCAKTSLEKKKISSEKKNLVSLVRRKSGEMEANTLRIKTLESDLSKTQGQLKEMKKVDLQMHTRKVNGNESQPVEPVQQAVAVYPEAYSPAEPVPHAGETEPEDVTTEQKIDNPRKDEKEKVLAPGSTDVKPSKPDHYPYTIQVYSFLQKEESLRAAKASRKEGECIFTCPAYVPGKGHWYRVFLGCHRTLKDAKETASRLKKQKHPHAFVSKLPFAIRIESVSLEEDLDKIKSELQSKGFLAYGVPGKKCDNKTVLLVGAFKTEEEASQQAWSLRKKYFKPIVVRR